jgi:NAD(P)-dependent dehydrogenase (short-subunit alcohol dehydrogenase family)
MTRVAVVTGGSSGMGLACVRRYRAEGFAVASLDLASSTERDVLQVALDVTDPAALQAAAEHVRAELGAPVALVNAAGVYPPSTLATVTVDLYRRVFDVNVLGTLLATQAFAPVMADGGAVVNFSSINAFTPSAGQLLYCAAKAAIVQLTKSLALELGPRLRVNALAPGWVDTPGTRANERLEAAIPQIPLGRAAMPEEMADLVYLLAGEERALYVTGETVVASGGLVLR